MEERALTAAFDSTRERGQRHCICTVSPLHLPVFASPFSLSASYQHVTGFDYARGSYMTLNVAEFGQPGSSAATLVNGEGEERPGYVDNHHGNDWLLPKGTPITAVAGGKVIMARAYKSPCEDISDSRWQLELTILHTVQGSSGYYEHFATYYAHFSKLAVSEGDIVTQGQVVGYAGNTGCSSASHLHFGAYKLTNTGRPASGRCPTSKGLTSTTTAATSRSTRTGSLRRRVSIRGRGARTRRGR